ncbi:hypothetical protein ASD66_20170 [Nocardioides sp. Root151]|nr:hypothetical protein ASD66_20170 [Nocardioides sp. Root151]
MIAVILLTLLIGIIQASIFFWAYQTGANAAREGARQYAVDPCNADASDNVAKVKAFVGGAASGAITVTPTFSKGPGNTGAGKEPGDQVTVRVKFKSPSIGGFLPEFPDVEKTASARIEYVGGC